VCGILAISLQNSSKKAQFSFRQTGLSFTADEIRSLVDFVIFGIFRQNSSKIAHFSFGPTGLSFTIAVIRSLPVWCNFRDFSSKIIKKYVILVLVGWVFRLPVTRHGHSRSRVEVGIFLQKSSKIDHFSFGQTGQLFTVGEIGSLPVFGKLAISLQNSSKIAHFSFGQTGVSFAVAEIRSLPVWSNFRGFSSKIIKNRSI
jgi:hypothetical protein